MNIWTTPIGNNPLIRAIRHDTLNHQLEEKLAEIAKDTNTTPIVNSRATAAGDSRKLRGIPALARGVAGTSPGTDPLAHVIALERAAQLDARAPRNPMIGLRRRRRTLDAA